MRLTVILRENLCDQANTAIAARTGNPADVYTFTNPVLRNGNPVGRWCSWEFAGRNYTAAQVVNRLKTVLGLTDDEVLTRQDTIGSVDLATTRMVAFDGDQVDGQRVLDFLGLTVPVWDGPA